MDGFQLFKKLGFGAKFDLKRFGNDAKKLKIVEPKCVQSSDQFHASKQRSDEVEKVKGHNGRKRKTKQSDDIVPSKKAMQSKLPDESNSSSENDLSDDDDDLSGDSDEHDEGSNSGNDSDGSENSNSEESESDSESSEEGSVNPNENTERSQNIDSELQLLGNIRSTGKEGPSIETTTKKKKKKKDASKLNAQERKLKNLRKKQKIHVSGTDVPPPLTSFTDLATRYSLNQTLLTNIQNVGYADPTPVQRQAIPVMIERRELMACAPTGSGKTAAFIIPILHHLQEAGNQGFRALVLSPTRELAQQTFREFERLSEGLGFRTFYIDKASKAVKQLGPKSKKSYDILVTTPNRLVYILEKHPDVIKLASVEWLVIDESDKLFEEGKRGFRDQLGVIYKACESTHVRRAMFSATFAHSVENWCKLNLDNVIQVSVGHRNSATETIQQELVFVGGESGKLLAIRQLIQKGIQPPVLIFVQSKERAKELFKELVYDKVNVDVIHAERTQIERDNAVKSFRLGQTWVLIATELMGRGIDFKGVNLVVNYDFPFTAISYIHRIGRTGRAGRQGRAITYFTEDDSVYLRSIANVMRQAGCEVPDYMLKLSKPSKKKRKQLAHSAPDRRAITSKSQYDLEQEKKLKEEKMKTIYTRKPRKNSEGHKNSEGREMTSVVLKKKKGNRAKFDKKKTPGKHKGKEFAKKTKQRAE